VVNNDVPSRIGTFSRLFMLSDHGNLIPRQIAQQTTVAVMCDIEVAAWMGSMDLERKVVLQQLQGSR